MMNRTEAIINPIIKSVILSEDMFALYNNMKSQEGLTPETRNSMQFQTMKSEINLMIEPLFNKLVSVTQQLEVVSSLIEELKEQGNFSFDELLDGTITTAQNLMKMVINSKKELETKNFAQPQSSIVQENLSLTTITSLAFNTMQANGLRLLDQFEKVAKRFSLFKLTNTIRMMSLVLAKLTEPTKLNLSTDSSYLLYTAMWNRGFQASPTFLSEKEYKGDEKAKTVVEGAFYKLLIVFYSFPAFQQLLMLCVAMLNYLPESDYEFLAKIKEDLKSTSGNHDTAETNTNSNSTS